MVYYLDTNIVIYAVQAAASEHQRAVVYLAALEKAGHRFMISDLTRTEALVVPFQSGNPHLLSDFLRFFHGPNLRTVGLTEAIYLRAGAIRSGHTYPAIPPSQPKRYGLADALHLATAIECGCDVFLTNDNKLANFPDVTVEELP